MWILHPQESVLCPLGVDVQLLLAWLFYAVPCICWMAVSWLLCRGPHCTAQHTLCCLACVWELCPWDEPGFVCECHVWRKFSWVSLTIRLHKGSQWCSICHSGSPLLVPGLLFCVSLLISGRQSQENHVLRDFFTCMHSSVNFVEQSFLSNFLQTTFFFFYMKTSQ